MRLWKKAPCSPLGTSRPTHPAPKGVNIFHFALSLIFYFGASAYLTLMDFASFNLPWRHSFFIPIFLYLLAYFLRGARFAFLFKHHKTKIDGKMIMPYQEAMALNNISFFYLGDVFIYWFYRPFIPRPRLMGAIALVRIADLIPILAAFLYFSLSVGNFWRLFLAGAVGWGLVCLGYLWLRARKLLQRYFTRIFVLSLLAWLIEWLALCLLVLFNRGGEELWVWESLKNLFSVYIFGPHLMFRWFFLVHFILGFASLLMLSYKREY